MTWHDGEKFTAEDVKFTIEAIQDPLMRQIRVLDKLIDQLAKGKPLEKVLRK